MMQHFTTNQVRKTRFFLVAVSLSPIPMKTKAGMGMMHAGVLFEFQVTRAGVPFGDTSRAH